MNLHLKTDRDGVLILKKSGSFTDDRPWWTCAIRADGPFGPQIHAKVQALSRQEAREIFRAFLKDVADRSDVWCYRTMEPEPAPEPMS